PLWPAFRASQRTPEILDQRESARRSSRRFPETAPAPVADRRLRPACEIRLTDFPLASAPAEAHREGPVSPRGRPRYRKGLFLPVHFWHTDALLRAFIISRRGERITYAERSTYPT